MTRYLLLERRSSWFLLPQRIRENGAKEEKEEEEEEEKRALFARSYLPTVGWDLLIRIPASNALHGSYVRRILRTYEYMRAYSYTYCTCQAQYVLHMRQE